MQPDTASSGLLEKTDEGCYVAITHDRLQVESVTNKVRSPAAGAIVFFAGTTRNNADGKPVKELRYEAYEPRALRTMFEIARDIKAKYHLQGVAIVHRLGVVPIGEDSILIAVSAPHRQAAFDGGKEALEVCKIKTEIWKREEFLDGEYEWKQNECKPGGH